jgi:hypothetical protein
VVAGPRSIGTAARRVVLEGEAERLVVDARHSGLTLQELLHAIRRHWARTVSRAG